MRRKLIRQGVGGMTIYLPKKWVDEHHLDNGADVEVEQLEGDLLVSARRQDFKSSTSITLTHLTETAIRTLITNTYRSGYDIIQVSFEKERQFEILKNVIKTRLIGFEITKRDGASCIVENVTEPAPEQFETILRKLLYSVADLLQMAERYLADGRSAFDFEEAEERIQKYDNFCRRILSKRKLRVKNSEMLWTFLGLLVHAQREVYLILRLLPARVGPAARRMMAETRALFEMLKEAYIDRNISLFSEIHERHQELLYKLGYSILERAKGKEAIIAHHLISSMRQFYLASSPLAGYLV